MPVKVRHLFVILDNRRREQDRAELYSKARAYHRFKRFMTRRLSSGVWTFPVGWKIEDRGPIYSTKDDPTLGGLRGRLGLPPTTSAPRTVKGEPIAHTDGPLVGHRVTLGPSWLLISKNDTDLRLPSKAVGTVIGTTGIMRPVQVYVRWDGFESADVDFYNLGEEVVEVVEEPKTEDPALAEAKKRIQELEDKVSMLSMFPPGPDAPLAQQLEESKQAILKLEMRANKLARQLDKKAGKIDRQRARIRHFEELVGVLRRVKAESPAWVQEVMLEVARARDLFPSARFRLTAFSEEAGEVVKAVMDHMEEKVTGPAVRKEIIQVLAMAVRLLEEGDSVHGLYPVEMDRE